MSDPPATSHATSHADAILLELRAIRQLLAEAAAARLNAPPPVAASLTHVAASASEPTTPSPRPSTGGGGKFDDAPIPQPSQLIPDAGNVQVHFGKNTGIALSALGERSLSWYATDQPAKLDNQGQPFRPRPQEILLKNAARTLWHTNRGTLSGGLPQGQAQAPAQPAPSTQPNAANAADEENVPF